MSEVFGGHLNAGVFNYSGSTETLKQCVANDDTFRFMNSVKKKIFQEKIQMRGFGHCKTIGHSIIFSHIVLC